MKILTKEKIWIHGYGTFPEQVTVYKILGINAAILVYALLMSGLICICFIVSRG